MQQVFLQLFSHLMWCLCGVYYQPVFTAKTSKLTSLLAEKAQCNNLRVRTASDEVDQNDSQ